jgi:hypothetical protein
LIQKVRSQISYPLHPNFRFLINKLPAAPIADDGDFKYHFPLTCGSVYPIFYGSEGGLIHGSTSKKEVEPVVLFEHEYLVPGG